MSLIINIGKRLGYVKYPEQINLIIRQLPDLAFVPLKIIEVLWEEFSNEVYGASFVDMDEKTVNKFEEWINKDE